MSGAPASALVPVVIVLLVVLPTDFWVYVDAKAQWERGHPIVLSSGRFRIETPREWFVGCLVLWIVFFPLYLVGRGR
jgi:hypothetical protein